MLFPVRYLTDHYCSQQEWVWAFIIAVNIGNLRIIQERRTIAIGKAGKLLAPLRLMHASCPQVLTLSLTKSSQIRNISRMIWINVAPPPEGAPPPGIKGKTPLSDVTPQQLRRRKTEAIHLSL